MPKEAAVRERWECEKCHFIHETMLHVSAVFCPQGHKAKKVYDLRDERKKASVS